MPNYFQATCPACQHSLRIRAEYVGRQIVCKRCGQRGRVDVAQTGVAISPVEPPRQPGDSEQAATARDEASPVRIHALEAEVRKAREELEARDAAHAATLRLLQEAQLELSGLHGRMQGLQHELDRAREQVRADEAAREELADARARIAQLQDHVETLSRGAADAERLEGEHRQARHAEEQSRARVAELERSLAELERSLGDRSRELEEGRLRWGLEREDLRARSERDRRDALDAVDRLQAEVQELRTRSDRAAEGAEGRIRGLEAERDRLRGELEVLRPELDARTVGVEQMRSELQARSGEAEKLRRELDASRAGAVQARRRAEALEAVQAERDRLRDEVGVARREARAARDELAARAAEVEGLKQTVGEIEAVRAERERLGALQAQGARDSERLRARLGELERSLAERSAELEEVRRAWEVERRQMQDRWDEECRELLDEFEQKLREDRGRAQVEREGEQARWDAPLQLEHDRSDLRAELDRLSRELEAMREARDTALRQAEAIAHERDLLAHWRAPVGTGPLPEEQEPPPEAYLPAGAPDEDHWRAFERLTPPEETTAFPEPVPWSPRRAFPAALAIVGSLVVVAIGLVPYLFFPRTWDTYVLSIALILSGMMILGFIEGRFTGANPFWSALQTALIGGITIATVLFLGRQLL